MVSKVRVSEGDRWPATRAPLVVSPDSYAATSTLGEMSSAEIIPSAPDPEPKEVTFTLFDDLKKETPRKTNARFNNLASTENLNKNHHFYHKNCFTSSYELNNVNKKFSPDSRKENNVSKEFFNSLDTKLRGLGGAPQRQKRSPPSKPLDNRPMFVTTVKTGIFLEPPPELAAILGLHGYSNGSSVSTGSLHPSEDVVMYSYASRPRVVNNRNATKNNNNIRQKRDITTTQPKKV